MNKIVSNIICRFKWTIKLIQISQNMYYFYKNIN